MIHELKTWPEFFTAVYNGSKNFEIRKNDRDFNPGDTLVLREYDPSTDSYSGKETKRFVGFVFYGPALGVQAGYCVMGLHILP